MNKRIEMVALKAAMEIEQIVKDLRNRENDPGYFIARKLFQEGWRAESFKTHEDGEVVIQINSPREEDIEVGMGGRNPDVVNISSTLTDDENEVFMKAIFPKKKGKKLEVLSHLVNLTVEEG